MCTVKIDSASGFKYTNAVFLMNKEMNCPEYKIERLKSTIGM